MISWNYTGSPGIVKVELLKGGTLKAVIGLSASVRENWSGSIRWTVSKKLPAGSDYRVRVTAKTNKACTDTSDGDFSIGR